MKYDLWQRLFTRFLETFHLKRFFIRNSSFKELHQSSYAKEIGQTLAVQLRHYSTLESEALLNTLSSHEEGLTEFEAQEQQLKVGLNEVAQEKPLTWWQHLWYCYRNPFNVLLSLLAVVAFLTDDLTGSVIISIMVLLSTFLRYWQESKSNKAAESLKAMVTNTAMVLRREINYSDLSLLQQRYGAKVKQLKEIQFEIPIQYLVPGDIILLSAGDMIPADCRIVKSKDLFVSQNSL